MNDYKETHNRSQLLDPAWDEEAYINGATYAEMYPRDASMAEAWEIAPDSFMSLEQTAEECGYPSWAAMEADLTENGDHR